MLVSMWRKKNLSTMLLGMQISIATLKNSMESPQKLKVLLAIYSKVTKSAYIKESPAHCSNIHNR